MTFQDRVEMEHAALVGNIERLEAFRGGDLYRDLPEAERDRLTTQLLFMRGYAEILRQRIAQWKGA